jgi:hypothetical protein
MSTQFSAQGSIIIKRLRTGDSIFISLTSDKALYQGIDTTTGTVSPDWSVAANQPTITPNITTARNATVNIVAGTIVWKYIGTALSFDASGNCTTTGYESKFQLNTSTGALKIIGNLASLTNDGDDSLEFNCTVRVNGVEYNVTRDINVRIQKISASSYVGLINTTAGTILSSSQTSTKLQMNLQYGTTFVQTFYVKLYKDNQLLQTITASNGVAEYTVNSSIVDGSQLFIAEFLINSTDTNVAARSGITIMDNADQYTIHCFVSSTNKTVDEGSPVTVSAEIINMTSGTVINPSGVTWSMDVMATDGEAAWTSLKHSATNSIQVTTTETDRDGNMYDVTVVGEASWSA